MWMTRNAKKKRKSLCQWKYFYNVSADFVEFHDVILGIQFNNASKERNISSEFKTIFKWFKVHHTRVYVLSKN